MKEYRAMGQRTLECYKQSLLGYFHGNLQGHNAHLDFRRKDFVSVTGLEGICVMLWQSLVVILSMF